MPHAEKRDGKLTGFWYGEVDRRKSVNIQKVRQQSSSLQNESTKLTATVRGNR